MWCQWSDCDFVSFHTAPVGKALKKQELKHGLWKTQLTELAIQPDVLHLRMDKNQCKASCRKKLSSQSASWTCREIQSQPQKEAGGANRPIRMSTCSGCSHSTEDSWGITVFLVNLPLPIFITLLILSNTRNLPHSAFIVWGVWDLHEYIAQVRSLHFIFFNASRKTKLVYIFNLKALHPNVPEDFIQPSFDLILFWNKT